MIIRKKIYGALFIAAVASSLFSCVTPRYKTPDNIIAQSVYRNGSSDTTTIAAIDWDVFYGDKYLRSLISEALDSNISLHLSISRIEQAKQYLYQSRAAFAPSFNASAQAIYTDPSSTGASQVAEGVKTPISDYTLSVSASWEIDIWGKISSSKRASYANLLATEAAKDAVVTDLVANIATAYYQLVVMDSKLAVTQKTISLYQDYLDKVSIMKEQGQTNEVAVLQAKAQLYGAKGYLPQVKSGITIMENYISLLLGKSCTPIERCNSLELNSINYSIDTGVPTALLQYRPDVRAAEFAMRSAHESFNVAKASMYPALTLTGQVGYESLAADTWFKPESLFWNAVGGLTAPIFNARALRTQKKVAELQKNDSYLQFKLSLLNAMMEVSNSILSLDSATEKAEYDKLQYEAISTAFDYSMDLFERGYATYLDVLTAQNGLFTTELSLYDSYLDVATQRIELYRALGGGWIR
ncbi:MAG: efflux transporter outer membrane subunit [Rikenellaceae bacterium]